MALNYNKFKFIIAILVILGIGVACSSKKDSTKEDTKKETTKEETKTDDSQNESSSIVTRI